MQPLVEGHSSPSGRPRGGVDSSVEDPAENRGAARRTSSADTDSAEEDSTNKPDGPRQRLCSHLQSRCLQSQALLPLRSLVPLQALSTIPDDRHLPRPSSFPRRLGCSLRFNDCLPLAHRSQIHRVGKYKEFNSV